MTASAPKSFRRQFFELVSGSTLAQVFSLLLMPVISRLYTPSDMGEYAIYVSISSIVGILANLRLDMAIVLARDEEEASRLAWLGMLSAVIVGLASFALLVFRFGAGEFTWMTALSITSIGGIQALVNWHSRHKFFKILASRNAGEKLLVLLFGIGLGFWGYTQFGLIASQTVGYIFSYGYLLYLSGIRAPRFARAMWSETISRFADFPVKNLGSTLLLSLSMFLPALLFASYFTKGEVGQYNLAQRVFDIPITLVGYTFSTVYYQHTQGLSDPERKRLFFKSLRGLALLFVPGFVFVALSGPSLFALIFGEGWRTAGELSRWLAVYSAARLFFTSQAPLLLVRRKLSLDFGVSLSLFLAQGAGFAIGSYYFGSLYAAVAAMSVLGALVYAGALALIASVLDTKA